MPPRPFEETTLAAPAHKFDGLVGRLGPTGEISPVGGRMAAILSHAGEMSVIWFVVLGFEVFWGAKSVRFAALAFVAFCGEWMTTNRLMKGVIARSRPARVQRLPHGVRQPHSPSFPSGHASAAGFALPMLEIGHFSLGWILLAGSGICWSRIYLRLHYPSDVLVGWVWGLALGFITRNVVSFLTQ
jgi:undecaprenyl-diphosphatase